MRRICSIALLFVVTAIAVGQSGVPAHNPGPPKKGEKLPPILPDEQLWGANFQYPYQKRSYQIARKISSVLHQQPCYCYCDRIGHRSLRSCFESTHAAQCPACMKEAFYAYRETQKGKTAAQIRDGIIRGEWKSIDLDQAARTY